MVPGSSRANLVNRHDLPGGRVLQKRKLSQGLGGGRDNVPQTSSGGWSVGLSLVLERGQWKSGPRPPSLALCGKTGAGSPLGPLIRLLHPHRPPCLLALSTYSRTLSAHSVLVLLLSVGTGYLCMCSVAQSCLTLRDPVDCNPPGSSVPGILQAKILGWVAMSSSRGSSRSRDQTHIS